MSSDESILITMSDPAAETRLKRVVKRIHDLPSFPLVIRKLMEVAEDPDSSSRDLAKVMENDQGLSAKILKLVNSAFYSFSKPVASLQHAVTLLGYNSIRSLAMSVSVKSMFKGLGEAFDLEAFWSHSLATAIGAKLLADKHRLPFKDDLFTAGLLHDIGILLEARYLPEEMIQVIDSVQTTGQDILAAELKYIGVTHTVLGCWLAERWRLPATLRAPILRHHDLTGGETPGGETPGVEIDGEEAEVDRQVNLMVQIVCVANLAAHALGYSPIPTVTIPTVGGDGPSPEGDEEPGRLFDVPASLRSLFDRCPPQEFLLEVEEKFADSREFLKI